jgi:hypothetical protein
MKFSGNWLRLACRLTRLGILFAEPLDTASGIHKLLLAGEERVAGGANFYVDIPLMGGAGGEPVAAGALHTDFAVIGMNLFLGHFPETFPAGYVNTYFKPSFPTFPEDLSSGAWGGNPLI